MTVSLQKFVQDSYAGSNEWTQVSKLADSLCPHLNTPEALASIRNANQPGQRSSTVQAKIAVGAVLLEPRPLALNEKVKAT